MIINHERPEYIKARAKIGKGKWNGAYYYSIEICERIIPLYQQFLHMEVEAVEKA